VAAAESGFMGGDTWKKPEKLGLMSSFIITSTYGDTSLWYYSYALAKELANRSHKVTIIITGQRNDLVSSETNPAIYTWPSVKPKTLSDFKFMQKLIKSVQPDCVIGYIAGINVSMIMSWLNGVNVRMAYYQIISRAIERDTDLSKGIIFFQRMRKKIVYKLTNNLIAVSKACAVDLIRTYNVPSKKVNILPLLIDDFGTKQRFVNRCQKIVCVARLDHNKGQDILIKAIPSIVKDNPGLKTFFIGDGPYKKIYEELVNEIDMEGNVIFTGKISLAETKAHMASALALILPTRDDALPLVIPEAMSVGTPVIACNVGGIPEIIDDHVTGLLFSQENHKELSQKVIELLNDLALWKKLSKNGLEHFIRYRSMQNISNHADYFENLVRSA